MLESACDRVVVAVPPDRTGAPDRVAGGDSRSESVRAALRAAPEARIAVVHDAARPLVTRELVEACVAAVDEGWDGAVAAARVSDTIKEAGADERVTRTLDRGMLWAVQTPQAFGADASPVLLISAGIGGSPVHTNAPLTMHCANQTSLIVKCVASSHAERDFGSGL